MARSMEDDSSTFTPMQAAIPTERAFGTSVGGACVRAGAGMDQRAGAVDALLLAGVDARRCHHAPLLFGLLLVFAQSSAVAPFIYTLF
jgi:hypothetical protein